MANFDAALIKEQGVEFAVVAVRPGVISQPTRREDARSAFSASFGGGPGRAHGAERWPSPLPRPQRPGGLPGQRLRRAGPLVELVAQLSHRYGPVPWPPNMC